VGLTIKNLRIKKGNPRIDIIDPGIFFAPSTFHEGGKEELR